MSLDAPTDAQIQALQAQTALPQIRVVIADDQDCLHEFDLHAPDVQSAADKVLRGLDIVGYRGLRVVSCCVCLD